MKKTLLMIFMIIMLFCCFCGCAKKAVSPEAPISNQTMVKINTILDENEIVKDSLKDSAIIMLLYPYICEAVNKYFGEPTQWILDNAIINFISKADTFNHYKISVTVETFHGPHNPPYGKETMIFFIKPGNISLEEYIHEDIE